MSERFIADENFSFAITQMLRGDGHDVTHVREIMAGTEDPDIVVEAHRLDAIILTFDRDFGELTVRRRMPSVGIVLFRLGRQTPDEIVASIRAFMTSPPSLRGFFTVVNEQQVRQRPILRVVAQE